MPAVSSGEVNFYQHSVKLLDGLCTVLNECVTFIDDSFAEVLHWHGGATALFNIGVQDVREFSAFESCNKSQKKAAFLLSRPMTESYMSTLRDIVTASSFHCVVIVTSLSPAMHSFFEFGSQVDDDTKAFNSYKRQILDWMGTKISSGSCSVEILHVPLVAVSILPSLFVLPSHTSLFPILPTDFHFIGRKDENRSSMGSASIEFAHLPKNLQLQFKLLVSSLNSLLGVLDCSEEIFAVGVTSNILATELASLSWSKARRMNASCKASLLLVDRTLDLSSVVGHSQDSLLDKIVSLLPRLPGHGNDVMVDMAPVSVTLSNPNNSIVAPGCLAHPDDSSTTALLSTLAMLKYKEALLEMNRLLLEAISRESLDPSASVIGTGKVHPDQLEAQVKLFRGHSNTMRKHSGVLQLVLAVIQTLRHPSNAKLDTLLGIEKGLLQCLGDDRTTSPIAQLVQTLQREMSLSTAERLLTLDDVLLVIAYIYSLIGDCYVIPTEDEASLKTVLCQAVMNWTEPSVFSQLFDGETRSERKSVVVVQSVLEKLKGLTSARNGLKKYKNIYEPGSLSSPAKFQPMLRQLVADIVDTNKPELIDVSHKSSGYGNLLKAGFGLFRAVSKPRPSDHPLLIVFVVGGVTSSEVRLIRDVAALAKCGTQILVGSTSLVNPSDVLRMTLVQDNLHP